MTDHFDQESLSALISYRIERATETLEAAHYLAKGDYYNLAVGRLYYACFYAASALMLASGLSVATHAGMRTMLNLNFIKKGILEQRYGWIYQSLFEKRQNGDYDDFVYCDDLMYQAISTSHRLC